MSDKLEKLFPQVLSGYYTYAPVPVAVHGAEVQVVSKMGLSSGPDDYAAHLLATEVVLKPDDRVAVIGCGCGLIVAAAALQVRDGPVVALDSDCVAVEATRRAIELNSIENAQVLYSDGTKAIQGQTFDAILINLPKGKELVHQLIADAHRLLAIGGHLYLAGANNAGIKRFSRVVDEVFGNLQVLVYRKGHRVVRAAKLRPDMRAAPFAEPAYYAAQVLSVEVRGKPYEVLTKPGIFSWNKLDAGTEALLAAVDFHAGDTILDLGCGYGIVSVVAADLSAPGAIYAVDANAAAIDVTTQNVQRHAIEDATVLASDAISAVRHVQFDAVITNPPFHAGIGTEFATSLAFIAGSADVLKSGGRLYLVANRFIKYEPYLERLFSAVHTVHRDNRFKVLMGVR